MDRSEKICEESGEMGLHIDEICKLIPQGLTSNMFVAMERARLDRNVFSASLGFSGDIRITALV
jgi:hypothetical protein